MLRSLLAVSPAVENILSELAEVDGMPRRSLATAESLGYLEVFFHQARTQPSFI